MTNTMDPSAIIRGVDHASAQSDRWLFLALLVVVAVAFYFAIRWMAGQFSRLLEQWRTDMMAMQSELKALHEERVKAADAYAAELRAIMKEQSEAAKVGSQLLTSALLKNAEVIGGVQQTMKDLQSSCSLARASLLGVGAPPRPGGAGASGT